MLYKEWNSRWRIVMKTSIEEYLLLLIHLGIYYIKTNLNAPFNMHKKLGWIFLMIMFLYTKIKPCFSSSFSSLEPSSLSISIFIIFLNIIFKLSYCERVICFYELFRILISKLIESRYMIWILSHMWFPWPCPCMILTLIASSYC